MLINIIINHATYVFIRMYIHMYTKVSANYPFVYLFLHIFLSPSWQQCIILCLSKLYRLSYYLCSRPDFYSLTHCYFKPIISHTSYPSAYFSCHSDSKHMYRSLLLYNTEYWRLKTKFCMHTMYTRRYWKKRHWNILILQLQFHSINRLQFVRI